MYRKEECHMKPALVKRPGFETPQAAPSRIQRILVAVDFSEDSCHALTYAAGLAAEFDASLTLVHVVEPHFGPGVANSTASTKGEPEGAEFAEAKLELNDLGARMLGPCRVVETVVRGGLAFFEITEAAQALGADLIVLGTHGSNGLQRALLGSTAEKVVRHAPCPVLVARPTNARTIL